MDFPRLVYKSASSHKLVNTPDEYGKAMREGFFGSVPEAVAGVASSPAPVVKAATENLGDATAPVVPAVVEPVLTKAQQKAAAKAAQSPAPVVPAVVQNVPPTESQPGPAATVKQPWD